MDISDSIHPVAREVYKLATCPSQYPQWTQLPTNYETVQHCNKHRRNCRFLHLSSGKAIRAKPHGKAIDTFPNLQKRQFDGNVQGWTSTDCQAGEVEATWNLGDNNLAFDCLQLSGGRFPMFAAFVTPTDAGDYTLQVFTDGDCGALGSCGTYNGPTCVPFSDGFLSLQI
jgi:hypothetical protein